MTTKNDVNEDHVGRVSGRLDSIINTAAGWHDVEEPEVHAV